MAVLNDERPRAWLQYQDGSWAPVAEDGRVGPAITAEDLLAVTQQDLDALEAAGFITEVIDVEPLSVVDVEYGTQQGGQTGLALECGPADRPVAAEIHLNGGRITARDTSEGSR
ncbi:hypothetical protein D7D52_24880 [Nocardia yunnanensis]|uniref:Uncharacterized protein n=1 Tax=Nocardia yunnanensis TaxID=2382165 RepID=A0A386ZGD9_9NOCA|nr:hypothetical protein D7D52_24880 [Nocardia yunnanensis]